ncbi:hypothetical protein [Actinophytocola sp. NPDC049390]|uniref:hypothetical protein n=1 Tax=Actinophytocola sp. NPDC049390 TaxID=3363894 RepID=UPI0037B22BC5
MADVPRPGSAGLLGFLWFGALALGPLGGLGVVVLAMVLAMRGSWFTAGVALVGGVVLAGLLHVAGLVAMFLAGKGKRPGLPVVIAALCGCAGVVAAAGGIAWAVVVAISGAEWTAVHVALGGLAIGAVLVAVGSGTAHRKRAVPA